MPRKSGSRPSDPSTDRPARLAIGNLLRGILVFATVTIPFGLAFDWWTGLPANATATYIGRDRCASCHSQQMNSWQGSDHDLAMDHATPQSVLADFDDVHLEHHGAVARMYRKNEQYWVQTEGPDGQQHDYQIQYVFGVRPLQQYLVEFDRPTDMPPNQVGRMQVLRWSWDTERKRWFHLDPPDVPNEKLAPDDPLHWTKSAQNWNHMCAECHSTNLQKNFDVKSRTYHTEFSEIDVSCETCHGPGSLHVQLASARSLFWDRERGYGLDKMKQHTALEEIESCAPCHSRRSGVHPGEHTDKSYFDRFDLEVLRPLTYYPDGQIRDEVYEFGSFMQSKMFHKGIRCTDCHDPHSSRVYFEDNRLCTSCHAHSPSKYDTPAHHHHAIGSTGSQCVSCHMPETPYMAIDLRRDHGLRSPRPDLSVSIQTPNACTGCHVNSTPVPGESQVDDETKKTFQHYTDWLNARSRGNESVGRELARIDQWSSDWFTQWYGQKDRPEWPTTLAAAWNGDPKSIPGLVKMIENRELPAMIRASALVQLAELDAAEATRLGSRVVRESDPLLRTAALRAMQPQPPENWKDVIASRMLDSVRLVRTEAAQMLAGVPVSELSIEQQRARHRSLDEYRDGLMVNADQAGALTMLGVLAEQQGLADKAVEAYRTAIYVQPDVTGPRSNLATLLERQGDPAEAASLRSEELKLLARDANMAPQHAGTQYRYALGLYLNQRPLEAVPVMQKACSLEPNNVTFRLMLAMLFEQLGRWDEAIAAIDVILSTEPNDPSANEVRKRITAARDRSATTPSDSMPNPSSTP